MALLDEEKPPTKTQLKKIAKLRGDPQNVTNRGQADDYLSDLEDQAEELKERAEDALEEIVCLDLILSVEKPSKAIMEKAILFGESRGWGENWGELSDPYDLEERLEFAIYSVAPELLKKGESPPRPPNQNDETNSQNKGCLLVVFAILLALIVIWWLYTL